MNYYDSISNSYDELYSEEQKKKLAIIETKLKVTESDKLLDVGCGTGITTLPWNCQRYGVDPSKELLKKASFGPIYKLAKAEKIPFQDDYFDFVISITAIQNFENIKKGLEEIKRVGKDKFVLSFLKRSPNSEIIEKEIQNIFSINERIEEEKDIIFFIGKF